MRTITYLSRRSVIVGIFSGGMVVGTPIGAYLIFTILRSRGLAVPVPSALVLVGYAVVAMPHLSVALLCVALFRIFGVKSNESSIAVRLAKRIAMLSFLGLVPVSLLAARVRYIDPSTGSSWFQGDPQLWSCLTLLVVGVMLWQGLKAVFLIRRLWIMGVGADRVAITLF